MIYFDNAATTPIWQYPLGENSYNPSSPHLLGIAAERQLQQNRVSLSVLLGCHDSELYFTSGGTESNNLAILGFALAHSKRRTIVLAQPFEHPSILTPIKFAAERGFIQGLITPISEWPNLADKADIMLICLSQVHHETGDITDINAIKKSYPSAIIFVDGAQGFCKEPFILGGNVDMYSFSAHKFHGHGGIGGLVIRNGIRLVPFMHGGGQERGLRAGTENMAGITGMAAVAKTMCLSREKNHAQIAAIKAYMATLCHELPNVVINAASAHTSPYILNMSFLGLKGEILVHMLSEQGLHVSMGAACQSRKKSHSTLEFMGFSAERATSALRFSFSSKNTMDEAVLAHEIVKVTVQKLRGMI